jgi:hypothetical protein
MKRKDIINTLIDDVHNNLHPGNGFTLQPTKIYRGYFQFDEIKQTPALSFTITSDNKLENIIDEDRELRSLEISSYGYAKSNGAGDCSEIHDLLEDLETFLKSDNFTYHEAVNLGNATIYEGGISDPANIFQLDFSLVYIND